MSSPPIVTFGKIEDGPTYFIIFESTYKHGCYTQSVKVLQGFNHPPPFPRPYCTKQVCGIFILNFSSKLYNQRRRTGGGHGGGLTLPSWVLKKKCQKMLAKREKGGRKTQFDLKRLQIR